jgi:hydroxyacylglutathione hydrolase
VELAGLTLTVDQTPGHTPGSVTFRSVAGEWSGPAMLVSGDTLFAGSIGRTDLPGGDHEQMLGSLRDKILVLDDETVVLPGHGPQTTIGRERASNPFLHGLRAPGRARGL